MDGSRHSLDDSAFGSSRIDLSVGRLLRCVSCRLGFSEARSSEEQLKSLYGRLDAVVYESETPGRIRTAGRHLKILSRYASHPGRLLDVGCASGRFASSCVDAGWNVVGLEPSEVFSAHAKNLLRGRAEILATTLQDAEPAGVLLINVPNLDSLPSRVLGQRLAVVVTGTLELLQSAKPPRVCWPEPIRTARSGQPARELLRAIHIPSRQPACASFGRLEPAGEPIGGGRLGSARLDGRALCGLGRIEMTLSRRDTNSFRCG
jgi:SAM-dependent methyltransferase